MTALLVIAALASGAAGGLFVAWRFERHHRINLELLLDSANAQLRLAELTAQLAKPDAEEPAPAASATDDPPAGTAGPAGREGRSPTPDPEQESRDVPAEPVDGPPDTAAAPQESERPADDGRTTAEVAIRRDAPGATTRRLTAKQEQCLAAVRDLGEAPLSEIAELTALWARIPAPYRNFLALGRGSRWMPAAQDTAGSDSSPSDEAPEPEPTPDLRGEIGPFEERIIALVDEHGPVSSDWIADQVVKNRREIGVLMRDLARDGYLVDLDGAIFASSDLEGAMSQYAAWIERQDPPSVPPEQEAENG